MRGLTLASLFSDRAVLQRSGATAVWGCAPPGQTITVTLGPIRSQIRADGQGRWRVGLDLRTVAEGPFDLVVEGAERVVSSDILVGEVWLCAGQSNMAFSLDRATGAAEEIARPANPRLRQFRVAEARADQPAAEVRGAWVEFNAHNAPSLSAVAHFFSAKLQEELKEPVGVIVAARAGTNAIAWISQDAIDGDPRLHALQTDALRAEADYPQEKADYIKAMASWEKAYGREDHPADPSLFAAPHAAEQSWKPAALPAHLRDLGLPDSGAVWLRRTISMPAPAPAVPVMCDLGQPHDFDSVYWNGHRIGGTTEATATGPADAARHAVPHELITEGENLLAVRIFTPTENAGLNAAPFLMIGPDRRLLTAGWQGRLEYELPPLSPAAREQCPRVPSQPDPFCTGARLYNAMIAPLLAATVAGVLWYQGEQDAGKPRELYRELLQTLIRDWRRHAGGDLPFVICQLPNYGPKQAEPGESAWAEIRQAQLDALALPRVAEAVLIDVGESDVHPPDKKPVGERAAGAALHLVRGHEGLAGGIVLSSVEARGAEVVLRFRDSGGPLVARPLPARYQPTAFSPDTQPLVLPSPGSPLQGFALRGDDGTWRWAEARIEGDTVVVSSATVPHPVAVRYAWADNPICNLDNASGLPASPFEATIGPGPAKQPSANPSFQ